MKRLNFPALAILFALAVAKAVAAPDPESQSAQMAAPAAGAEKSDDSTAITQSTKFRAQLEREIKDGALIALQGKSGEFLALERLPEEEIPGGALIIAGRPGSILVGPPLLDEISRAAIDEKWQTLTLQMPLPGDLGETTQTESTARIEAAIKYFEGKGIANIVIVSEQLSASWFVKMIANAKPSSVTGFVGLGHWVAAEAPLTIPILAVTGSTDRPAIDTLQRLVGKRKADFTQLETYIVDGAGPRFRGYETVVARRVRGWVARNLAGGALSR